MLPYPVILSIAIVSLVVVSLVAYAVTGTFLSILVVLGIAALIFFLLKQFGILSIAWKGNEMDIDFQSKVPVPHKKTEPIVPMVIDKREVFHISGDQYTYEEAPAVCAAYDAELATYDQIQEAFAKGAEWCEYGWSQGGMALFPTQESTWQSIQSEPNRTLCGRPGINGGYMDPKLKFGVNCYGVKPGNVHSVHLPQPVPGSAPSTKAFNGMVDKFKKTLSQMNVSPFNRSEWSEATTLANAKKDIAHTAASAKKTISSYL
jgi:hypothetical protein